MSVRTLGEKAGIGFAAISQFENGRPMRESNKAKLLAVFEGAGVEILNGDAPGARLRSRALDNVYRIDFAKGGGGFTAHPEGDALQRAFPIEATPQKMQAWMADHGFVMVDQNPDRWRERP